LFKKTSCTFHCGILVKSLLVLSLTACGGGSSDKSETPIAKCNLTWQLDTEQSSTETQSETLINSCTNNMALFDTPNDEVEWDLNSANGRRNIIIAGDLLSDATAINNTWQYNAEGELIRGVRNVDLIPNELQQRTSTILHPGNILTLVISQLSKDSEGLSVMSYEQVISNKSDSGDYEDWERDMYCFYNEKSDDGRCFALNKTFSEEGSYVLVSIFRYDEWLEIKEQFDRGVEVDSATTISIILNDKRIDL
jgi:hypothetical protein